MIAYRVASHWLSVLCCLSALVREQPVLAVLLLLQVDIEFENSGSTEGSAPDKAYKVWGSSYHSRACSKHPSDAGVKPLAGRIECEQWCSTSVPAGWLCCRHQPQAVVD